jgi:hypothetical protein
MCKCGPLTWANTLAILCSIFAEICARAAYVRLAQDGIICKICRYIYRICSTYTGIFCRLYRPVPALCICGHSHLRSQSSQATSLPHLQKQLLPLQLEPLQRHCSISLLLHLLHHICICLLKMESLPVDCVLLLAKASGRPVLPGVDTPYLD